MENTLFPDTNSDLGLIKGTLLEALNTGDPALYDSLLADALSHPAVAGLDPYSSVSVLQDLLGLGAESMDDNQGPHQIEHLASLDPEKLTESQRTIISAHQQYDTFASIPSVKKSRDEQRSVAWNFARSIIGSDNTLVIGLSAWEVRSDNQSSETIHQRLVEAAQRNWETLSPTELARLVKASLHPQSAKFAEAILTGFFKGPQDHTGSVEALVRFTDGVLDLIKDEAALKKALMIGHFLTPVVDRDSVYNQKVAGVIRHGAFDKPVFNKPVITTDDKKTHVQSADSMIGKAIAANEILTSLSALTSLDMQAINTEYEEYFKSSLKWKKTIESNMKTMLSCLSEQEILQRMAKIAESGALIQPIIEPGMMAKLSAMWPRMHVYETDLHRRYKDMAQVLPSTEFVKQELLNSLKESGASPYFVRIFRPDNTVLEVRIPDLSYQETMPLIIKGAISYLGSKEYHDEKAQLNLTGDGHRLISGTFQFGETPIRFLQRSRAGIESEHPAATLSLLGFPKQAVPEGKKIEELVQEKQSEMQLNQRRFLMARGVKYIFNTADFRGLPYDSVIFRKSGDGIEVNIAIDSQDEPYKLRLNSEFDLDLEGYEFGDPVFKNNLHLTLLKILDPLLCADPNGDEHIQEGADGSVEEVLIRCGHLRTLPAGHRPSENAAYNFLIEQGGDLSTRNAAQYPITGKLVTYVREVVREGAELPPLRLTLPQNLFR